MYLGNFIKNLNRRYHKTYFSGLAFNSKQVKKDNIFFAIEGEKFDGKKYIFEAIKKGGSTIRDFKNVSGAKGNFQNSFKVYQRDGLHCKITKCKGIIEKKNTSNRSTFFCNICQK